MDPSRELLRWRTIGFGELGRGFRNRQDWLVHVYIAVHETVVASTCVC
eukprot:COSAG01_NODE_58848_length_303_cov_1.313725_1_plen_47_part_10